MSSENIKLVLAYDGKEHKGWQKTGKEKEGVESFLQKLLEQILRHPIKLQAASRTDAGVHATGQVVNFFTEKKINLSCLQMSLNQLLPKSIVVLSTDRVPRTFHPTIDCLGKEYRYYLCYDTMQLPHLRFYSWHFPFPKLEINLMKQTAQSLVGIHDFSMFCNQQKSQQYTSWVREITKIEIAELNPKRLCISISGNHFLYKMVRNLVGTLVFCGCGKIDPAEIPALIQRRDRKNCGLTAPAHGLFLHQIFY